MVWRKSAHCKLLDLRKIVIPDSPTNVTVSYNKKSEEYEFNIYVKYELHDFLIDNVHHELVLRKEEIPWPDCKDETHKGDRKVCFTNPTSDLNIPKRNLDYSTTYEARVRSRPNREYFDGFWSPWSAITTFRTEETDVDAIAYFVSYISIPFFLVVAVILIAVFWKRIKPFIWPEIPDHKKTLEKFCKKPKQNIHISFNPDYYEIIPINKIDYIKALEIPDIDHDIGTTDSSTGKSSVSACHTILFPVEGGSGPPTNTNNSGQCKTPADHREDSLEKPLNFGTMTLLPNNDVSENCTQSSGSNGIVSVAVKHPENGLKGLCWEDIYIAMSAFKTPSSAVKQVPKNTF
ncbi:hypothetical protein PRIEUP_LOCUS1456 [Pristimantis euphronides]